MRPASLRPPRPTNGDGGPSRTTGSSGGHQARRLLGGRTGDEDVAGGDGRLGLLPGVDEAASHELGVEPAAGPGGQLAALLVAELSASERFLVLAWAFLASGLGGLAGVFMPGRRDGATLVAASRARVAVLPACAVTSLAVLPACAGHVLGGVATGLGRLLHDLGHLLGQGLQGLRVDALELAGHLVAHQLEDLLARLAAPLDQVVDPLLCLAALDVPGVHQLSHDLLGPTAADLPEDGPRIEVFAYALIACHFTRVSEVLAAGKHFIGVASRASRTSPRRSGATTAASASAGRCARAGDPREDQGEGNAELGRQPPVGRRAVAHHGPQLPRPHQPVDGVRGRAVRLPRHLRSRARRRGDGGQQGPGTRHGAVGGGVGWRPRWCR